MYKSKNICCKCLGGKPKYWRLLPAPTSECEECGNRALSFSEKIARSFIKEYGYDTRGIFKTEGC